MSIEPKIAHMDAAYYMLNFPASAELQKDVATLIARAEAAEAELAAFKQEVSDAVEKAVAFLGKQTETHPRGRISIDLARFILPKPAPADQLVEAVKTVLAGFENDNHAASYANQIREALAKRGLTVAPIEEDAPDPEPQPDADKVAVMDIFNTVFTQFTFLECEVSDTLAAYRKHKDAAVAEAVRPWRELVERGINLQRGTQWFDWAAQARALLAKGAA